MGAFRDLTGMRFGRLLVLERAGSNAWKNARWLYRCDCGVEKTADSTDLIQNRVKSCGCLNREVAKHTTHGHACKGKLSPEYHCWASMTARCLNPKKRAFKRYRGRGITVCERWHNSFATFLADMGPRPKRTSIHRVNNDGNYEPSNCVWGTRAEHETNKSRPRAKPVTVEGTRYESVSAAARAYNVNSGSVRSRMRCCGNTAARAIAALRNKKHPKARSVVVEGIRYESVLAAARTYGVNPDRLRIRMRRSHETARRAIFTLLKRKPR